MDFLPAPGDVVAKVEVCLAADLATITFTNGKKVSIKLYGDVPDALRSESRPR